MPWLRGGTVAVTNGSTTVVGTNADFAANARSGDAFVGPDGLNYEIGNVAGATVISIIPAYKGPTVSGSAYAIMPVQGYPKTLTDEFRNISLQWGQKLAALGTTGNYETLPISKGGTGATTQADARTALGLVPTTSRIDTTAGRMVKVGDFGRNGGANIVQAANVDANALTVPASYVFNGGGINVPESAYLDVINHAAAGYSKQFATGLLTDNCYTRVQNNGNFGAWRQFVTRPISGAIAVAEGGTGGTTQATARTGLGLKSAAVADIVGPVSQAAGVPTGAVMSYSIDTTTGDRKTFYANGQMTFDGTRQANVAVGPGAFIAPAIARPAEFVGNVSSSSDLAFFTGGSATGNQLYATRQSLTSSTNLYFGAFINMGRSPATETPNLALGSTTAQSYLFWFSSVGRWF